MERASPTLQFKKLTAVIAAGVGNWVWRSGTEIPFINDFLLGERTHIIILTSLEFVFICSIVFSTTRILIQKIKKTHKTSCFRNFEVETSSRIAKQSFQSSETATCYSWNESDFFFRLLKKKKSLSCFL